jgi:dolichyl-phosphate-mannose--protein O-mannosyl transferase
MCQGHVFNVYCETLAVIAFFLLPVGYRWASKQLVWVWVETAAFPMASCASLFPFALMRRQIFFYHYIISHLFGMITCVAVLDRFLAQFERIEGMVLAYSQILAVLTFYFWLVWTYGIQKEDFDIRLWNKLWQ